MSASVDRHPSGELLQRTIVFLTALCRWVPLTCLIRVCDVRDNVKVKACASADTRLAFSDTEISSRPSARYLSEAQPYGTIRFRRPPSSTSYLL